MLAQEGGQGITGVHASATLARLHIRRGDTEKVTSAVQELWEVAETCGLLHHIAPAASALAEQAELTGEWAAAVPPLRSEETARDMLRDASRTPSPVAEKLTLSSASMPIFAPSAIAS